METPARTTPAKRSASKIAQRSTNSETVAEVRAPRRTAAKRTVIDETTRQAMIAEAAYFRAKQRNFATGHEMEDWLHAEAAVNRLLEGEHYCGD